ncbi:MAG: DUF2335 domain-containing protein [Bacteroidia bacterium]
MSSKNINKGSKNNELENSQELPQELITVIKDLSPEKRKVIAQVFAIKQHHSGPLPDSDTIKIYSEVIPNGGDRLMTTVEKQLEHRIFIENKGVQRTFNQSSTGQWMAFIIALVFGLIAWDLAKNGHDRSAQILGGADLVALVVVFITGHYSKK